MRKGGERAREEGGNSKPKGSKPEEIELPPPDVSMVIEAAAKSVDPSWGR